MSNTAQKLTVARAFLVVFKWTLFGGAPLVGLYYLVTHVIIPVREEMGRAKGTTTVVDKEASGLVQAVQQARLTVEKHDANTEYLNQIAGAPERTVKTTPAEKRHSTARVVSTAGMSRGEEVVALLRLGAVIDGKPPRLLIDGKVVRPGELVNEEYGLRFHGLDVAEHAVLFANAAGAIFRRSY